MSAPRDTETLQRMIDLYEIEAERLSIELTATQDAGTAQAWNACKSALCSLYAEMLTHRVGNVERIRPGIDRRRRARGSKRKVA